MFIVREFWDSLFVVPEVNYCNFNCGFQPHCKRSIDHSIKSPRSLGHTNALEHPAVKIYTTGWRCRRILILNFNDQQYPVNKTAARSDLLAIVY